MLRRPPVSTLSDTLFPYTSLFRSIQLRQPLESGTTIDFIRIVNLAEIQPGSVLSLSPSSPAFFSLGTPRQATLTLIPPPWQPSNKVRSSKPIGRPTEQSYGPRWSTARLSIFHPQLSPATDPNAFHSFNARRAGCPRRACFAFCFGLRL